jgi:hypothetical protein
VCVCRAVKIGCGVDGIDGMDRWIDVCLAPWDSV